MQIKLQGIVLMEGKTSSENSFTSLVLKMTDQCADYFVLFQTMGEGMMRSEGTAMR